ncbi:MAG: hypothetical protein P4M15_03615 [Alphaproteobacteria bacterium]|nr:hypothetical protein [Alphaproteobacteria bacterium]
MAASNAESNNPEVQFIAQDLHIREGGSFGAKTWHEMDSSEFTTAMTAVCTYFECTPLVPLISAAIHAGQLTVGKNYAISGVIHKHVGEEWWIAFPAPAGYVTCSAKYDAQHINANKGDSTSGTVFRNPATGENWVGTYSEVPKNRPEGHWVDVDFVVKYVKAGTEGSHQCVANGTPVWAVNLAEKK